MKNLFVALCLLLSAPVLAQQKDIADTSAVHTIDGIVKEVLHVISGEAGKVRDWDHFRSLFLPTARFTLLYHPIDSMAVPWESVSLEELIEAMQDDYYQAGFTEYQLGRVIDEYNGIAQVFQSFYAKDSEGVEGKGVTSYQLVYFDKRWWISNILWTNDSNGVEIPERYLD